MTEREEERLLIESYITYQKLIEKEKKIRYFHFDIPAKETRWPFKRNKKNEPVCGKATICIWEDYSKYQIGVALCSPEDNFYKVRGRAHALASLLIGSLPLEYQTETDETFLYLEVDKTNTSLTDISRNAVKELIDRIRDCKLKRITSLNQFVKNFRWYMYADTDKITLRGRQRKNQNG